MSWLRHRRERRQRELILAVLEEQKAQTQQTFTISQGQYGLLAKAIADMASGNIGGRVGLGFETPKKPGKASQL
jgi:hypothetical protein